MFEKGTVSEGFACLYALIVESLKPPLLELWSKFDFAYGWHNMSTGGTDLSPWTQLQDCLKYGQEDIDFSHLFRMLQRTAHSSKTCENVVNYANP